MEPGDRIIIIEKRHPLCGCQGIVVGRRGVYNLNDLWLLVVIQGRNKSILIPQSMVQLEDDDTAPLIK